MKNFSMEMINSLVSAGLLRLSHYSWSRGYVSRKSDGIVRPYRGRFGVGFIVLTPSRRSSRYCYVTYYLTTDLFDEIFLEI